MMGRLSHSTAHFLLLTLLGASARANEIACASQSAGYLYCRGDTSKGVALIEQLGAFACNQGNTWGYDKGGVWVANGCAARFRLGPEKKSDDLADKAQGSGAEALARDLTSGARAARKKSAPAQPAEQDAAPAAPAATLANRNVAQPPQGQAFVLTCESKDYKLQKCPVPVRAHVHLKRKIGRAECRFNATWGYDYGEIWVSDGCRAEFAVQ